MAKTVAKTTVKGTTIKQSKAEAAATGAEEFIPAIGRIPIVDVFPSVSAGRWPAKAYAGEVVPFGATVFREGHDAVGARLELRDPAGVVSSFGLRMIGVGLDRYQTLAQLPTEGAWQFRIRAFSDDYETWHHNATIKVPAGIDVELMFQIAGELFTRAGADSARPTAERTLFLDLAATVLDSTAPAADRLAAGTSPAVVAAVEASPIASLDTYSEWLALNVERQRAGFGSWYEFFPRSLGASKADDGTWTSGTFRTAAARLPEVAAMGFDVLYLPPIHPIGEAFRKGPNNSLTVEPGDPGSPWAIGGTAGGHDAVHPDLGGMAAFKIFVEAANKAGLEVALDFALQASPDHPWVEEHPEWFTTLPDGSIAYAENPPKKYQDIYPINFDNDPSGIRAEALRIIRFWIAAGVKIFRVDNPHTKPLDFWEWLIGTVNAETPGIIWLAEAFTRPALMQTLAKVGFTQSYTYFTWRNTKEELEEFLDGLSHETAAFFRPNLFVNTPDILHAYLQFGGRPAYKVRAAIAATGAPTWGVYSGYELVENVARPGSEENIDNEKYEYRPRDFAAAEASGLSLAPYITRLNQIRNEHPALAQLRNLDIHAADDDSILVFSKYIAGEYTASGRPDGILVVANVDPHSVRETTVRLDVSKFGIEPGSTFRVTDQITGDSWIWGADNYVRLNAFAEPVHIFSVHYEPDPSAEPDVPATPGTTTVSSDGTDSL
ncbi:alpha-1,4-glucan--maltose-1-phosphate maltosyltransferase [Subtercola boreus]|uniref:alpha-1,4-glucan--maltose-1-phosphate maltosyltransferase n=1 Tax=Subtercola boreus TaxID=120213 RepID=UPI00116908A4|nr:alpha-1,4-glucan:maltose-1-phosphate maltosyltransferase [Subtercola boreus]